MKDFSHIDTWIFDLDNTLYGADIDIFPRIHQRMHRFVANHFDISLEEGQKKCRYFFETYNTTLRGLMIEQNVKPETFMEYVHDIDISDIRACEITQRALESLPGRKLIYTNASRGHAENITRHLGIDHHFEDIFDICAADYMPKPDQAAYETLIKKFGIIPARACMVEDMAVNLQPAAALGMTTLWLYRGAVDPEKDGDHIHHRAETLTDWFTDNLQQQETL